VASTGVQSDQESGSIGTKLPVFNDMFAANGVLLAVACRPTAVDLCLLFPECLFKFPS